MQQNVRVSIRVKLNILKSSSTTMFVTNYECTDIWVTSE